MVRILLYPFALLYGIVMLLRNKLFDWHVLPSYTCPKPVISVGNLSMGGTGKTPMVEYIIRLLLNNDQKIATLSRGYGRKAKGFIEASKDSNYLEVGDEPLQYKNKFTNVEVAVDEKRSRGLKVLYNMHQGLNAIILDDAFQHRYVKPGLSVLLTDYHKLFVHDYVFPTGNLREFRNGCKRADIIIVTKTPKVLSPLDRRQIESKVKTKQYQKLYFSTVDYEPLQPLPGIKAEKGEKDFNTILMFSGIANSYPMQEHLKTLCSELIVMEFPDHHKYTKKDLERITKTYRDVFSTHKAIITTEKDAMRLIKSNLINYLVDYPVYYIPIKVKFQDMDGQSFDKQVVEYVKKNSGKR